MASAGQSDLLAHDLSLLGLEENSTLPANAFDLKTPVRASVSEAEVLSQMEEDVVQEALRCGQDLGQYSADVEERLKKAERLAVKDYIKEAEQIACLHKEITTCDHVLEKIEGMLATFQADLGNISSDIQCLQEQSMKMNVRLKNRQAIRGELSQFIDYIAIPTSMVQIILEMPVTEREFLEQLHELQHKLTFVKNQEFRETRSCVDVHDTVQNLKIKSTEKIREYLLQRIYQFRKPLTNYQVPQNAMLKFRFFYEFLLANERDVAREIRDEYVDTLSKIFYSYFKTYAGRLMRLQHSDVATKEDLLGAEDTTRVASLFSSKPNVRNRATVFSIGTRANILSSELEAPIIVPHAAQQNHEKFHLEALFRSLQLAMVDHACHEFLFLTDFFLVNAQSAMELFVQVLGKAITVVMKTVEEQVASSFDAIALLLCIHIVYKYQMLMHKRAVPALDGYWNNVLGVLWRRFETVMHMHLDSVRMADIKKLGPIDTRPHYIVRRYAEFTSGLIGTATMTSHMDDRLQLHITQLQAEMEHLLAKLALQLDNSDTKQRLICLINNYDMILSVLTERLPEETRETESFKELLQTQINRFVEEILFPHFGALMNFVNECEPLVDQGHTELLRRYTEKVPNIVRSFSSNWKSAIDQINREVMQSFTNFKNGTNILQNALTQLVQYYHRFHKVLGHSAFSSCAAKNELVNIHHIMVELKKYKPVF